MSSWPPELDGASQHLASETLKYHAVEIAAIDGYRPLQVDVYLPAAQPAAPLPVVLFLHGGGWALGTRRRFGRAFRAWDPTPLERFVREGLAVVALDYRLSSEARFPAQLHDAQAAVRWIRAHHETLAINPQHIVAWGESAGGHLALMLGFTSGNTGLDGQVGEHLDVSYHVNAVVDWYGFSDLLASKSQRHPLSTLDHDAADSYESRLLGAPLQTVPDAAREASPMTHVHAGVPPVQIHHGDADLIVPYAQSETLVRALEELEVSVELVTLPDTDHFWIGAPDITAIFEASLNFAREAPRAKINRPE